METKEQIIERFKEKYGNDIAELKEIVCAGNNEMYNRDMAVFKFEHIEFMGDDDDDKKFELYVLIDNNMDNTMFVSQILEENDCVQIIELVETRDTIYSAIN